MKATLSFAEIRSLQKSLSKYEGGFIEKNYSSQSGYSFKLRKSGLESVYLHFVGDTFLFLSPENRIEGKKNSIPLENVPVERIKQIGTDRILEIAGQKSLIIEMMAGGNLVVNQDGSILFSEKPVKRKEGIISVGEKYRYPEIIDLESPGFSIRERVENSRSDPVRTLATRLGLSKYAEEAICALGGEIRDNDALIERESRLKDVISYILAKAEEGVLYVYDDEFFVMRSYCRREEPEIVPVDRGLEEIYLRSISDAGKKGEAILRSAEAMNRQMESLRSKGEYIMNNLREVDLLLKRVRKGEEEGNRVDYENNTLSLDAGGAEIALKLNETAGENANDYFNASKRIRDRLSRVRLEPRPQKTSAPPKKVKRVFTNYRWFINSDNNLVLGGKDAESNDAVVKKYLDEKDLYFHADIHGAPSVVMKVRNEVSERGIGEAASFAWCMSKAWSSEFGNGSVYYVTKSQVSKTPESGEYLARGAWIIRGRKSLIPHLSLELAVGFQKYENREYVVSAPPSSIKGRKVVIMPGKGKEDKVSEIAEFLGVEKEAVYPTLPPGGIEIKEKVAS